MLPEIAPRRIPTAFRTPRRAQWRNFSSIVRAKSRHRPRKLSRMLQQPTKECPGGWNLRLVGIPVSVRSERLARGRVPRPVSGAMGVRSAQVSDREGRDRNEYAAPPVQPASPDEATESTMWSRSDRSETASRRSAMRGTVASSSRLADETLAGYVGITEAKLPNRWHLGNVVKLKTA
jgi:hypothetical protein